MSVLYKNDLVKMKINRKFSDIIHNTHNECWSCGKDAFGCSVCTFRKAKLNYKHFEKL